MRRMRRYRPPGTNFSLFTFTPAWRTEIWVSGEAHRGDLPRTRGTVWLGFLRYGPPMPLLLRLWLRLSRAVTRRAGRKLQWTFRIR
jgi:hypothetical protein